MIPTARLRDLATGLAVSVALHTAAAALFLLIPAIETWPPTIVFWLGHLWQSTLFAIVAGLLTLGFQRHRASVRYWLWFSASLKFILPFSLVAALGARLPVASTVQTVSERAIAMTLPAGQATTARSIPARRPVRPAPNTPGLIETALLGIWACGFVSIVLVRVTTWERIRAVVRISKKFGDDRGGAEAPPYMRIRTAPGVLEPGVVGWLRPILLLPEGIERRLTPEQLDAVVTHEICHIRRHDNTTAAIHMLVEAAFWFHPLVWWIGARLVDERERACDEHVVRRHEPAVYAEGIVRVCRHYLESPIACVPGVTGSHLKARIETILRNEAPESLTTSRRLALAVAASLAIAVPMTAGMLSAPVRAQSPQAAPLPNLSFETASVKQNRSGEPGWRLQNLPGGRLTTTNTTAAELIQFAYDLPEFRVMGGPGWLESDRFDVTAKAEGDASLREKRLMVRRLLADRFKLMVRSEIREMPLYDLVMSRADKSLGPQLRRTTADCPEVAPLDGVGPPPRGVVPTCGYFGFAPGTDMPSAKGGLAFRGMTMPELATLVVNMVRRPVRDQTRLTGHFDGDFDFMSELPPPPPPPGLPNPWTEPFLSVFTVFPEQLGLKLESTRGPVEVLIIEAVERPTSE